MLVLVDLCAMKKHACLVFCSNQSNVHTHTHTHLHQARELAAAKPALDKAEVALNCLNKASIMELRGFKKPPPGVDKVTQACLILLHNETKNYSWSNGKKMMAKVDGFLRSLQVFAHTHTHTHTHTFRQ